MTHDRDFKQLVRARMLKTGESYTTARLQLRKKRDSEVQSPRTVGTTNSARPTAPALDVSKAGMADAVVRAKTGKTWGEWVVVLDAVGAEKMPHRDIAAYLHQQGVADWWAQTVTVGYERIRGLRDKGQRRGGGYEVSKSKTYAVPLGVLYRAFADTRTRNKWLAGIALTIRTATRDKSMRITWEDGSSLQLMFYAKDPGRSFVTVQHGKLATAADADRVRAFWTERLEALAAVLVPSKPKRATAPRRKRA